jgi:hypothetical protein
MLVVRVRSREEIVPFLFGGRVFDHGAAKRILLLPSVSLESALGAPPKRLRWVDAPVQTFVELLTERYARESLRAAAHPV